MIPFKFALVTKTPSDRLPFPQLKALMTQRLGLRGPFMIGALDNCHLLIRCMTEEDFIKILL